MSDKTVELPGQQQKLAQLEKELSTLSNSLQRGSRITAWVTVILLVVVGAYFVYGYSQFSSLFQPKPLVDAAATLLDDNIAPVRKTLEEEIIRNAPFWAEELSEQAIAAMPQLTDQAETYVMTQSRAALDHMKAVSMEQFRNVISLHRDEFSQLAAELKENESASTEVRKSIYDAMQQELGPEMQRDSAVLLRSLQTLNDKMGRIGKSAGTLSDDDRLLRQALMLVRHMQIEGGGGEVAVPTGAPLQGLIDRFNNKQEEPADDVPAAGARVSRRPAAKAPVRGSDETARAMKDITAEATALRQELQNAIRAADSAASAARTAADSAKDETAAAQKATEELKRVIEQAREALEKVKAAKGDGE